MEKKQLIIGGVILIILSFFGYRNYQYMEKESIQYEKEEKKREQNAPINTKSDYEYREKQSSQYTDEEIKRVQNIKEQRKSDYQNNVTKKTISKNSNKEKKIFIYSSDFYDIERPNGRVNTIDELTYHTFDFNKNIVTQNLVLNGERINITYPFTSMYEENGMLGTTYVLTVNTLGVKEIWWSPDVPNLGYDYDDGTRIACYDVKLRRN